LTDFAQKYGPWALIAGASEGIGACLADQLAARDRHGVQTGALVQDPPRIVAHPTAS
jgi:NAD(P)-dependent dehydrogenase (short-subunit alcohol dehydrogenase family)